MRRLLATLLFSVWAFSAQAVSTINPAVPGSNSQLVSAVVRNNFAAAYNDVNNILGKFAGTTAPMNQTQFQDWVDTSGGTTVHFNFWNPTTGTWITWGNLNISTGVFSPVAAAAASITVGTTIVSSGAGGILFDNGGLLGSKAVTGSGNAVLATAPTVSTLTVTGSLTATGLITAADLFGTTGSGGNVVLATGPTISGLTGTGTTALSLLNSSSHVITSAGSSALAVGLNGASNPAFAVDASAGTQVTGVKVTGAAAGGGAALAAISSNAAEGLSINAKGTGQITLGNVSTGGVAVSSALTYGGVTLSNSVTGTGSMVLSASPTISGTLTLGTPLSLANGGTNNTLTASAGGIPWSDGTKLNILAGTATPNLCLLSGNLVTPSWGSCSGGAAVTSVSNSDGTLTISPTTGAAVASLALGHANTWSAAQSFNSNDLKLNGSGSGALTINAPAAAGSNTLTFPAGTTDFSSTGGANQFVKQTSSGGAFTVAAISDADLPVNATAVTAPSDPAATTNATGVMMGIGGGTGACTLTPLIGTRILIIIDGFIANGTSGQNSNVKGLRFGTGTAPANAAALTGTVIGAPTSSAFKSAASPGSVPFAKAGIATGLTPGVAVWFDLGLASTAASSASIGQMTCTMEELR